MESMQVEKTTPITPSVTTSSTPTSISSKPSSTRKYKPTYLKMVERALSKTNVMSFASLARFIGTNFPVPSHFKTYLKAALKRGVKDKKIVAVKRSYKLAKKAPISRKAKIQKKVMEKRAERKKAIASRKTIAVATTTTTPKKTISTKKSDRGSSSDVYKKDPIATVVGELRFDHVWQFLENNGKWVNYDLKASDIVEEVYQKYLANKGDTDVRAIKSGQWEYMVDFAAMKQTNIQHENHTVRNIRRVPVK